MGSLPSYRLEETGSLGTASPGWLLLHACRGIPAHEGEARVAQRQMDNRGKKEQSTLLLTFRSEALDQGSSIYRELYLHLQVSEGRLSLVSLPDIRT